MPSGDFHPVYDQQGEVSDDAEGDPKVLTLGDTPKLGWHDRRPMAYGGAVLRILRDVPGDKTIIEEHIIESHDVDAGTVTTRTPFQYYEAGDSVWYEIAPIGMQSLLQAIAMRASISLGVDVDVSQKKMNDLKVEYQMALKTAGDIFTNMNMRRSKRYERWTKYNPDRAMWYLV